MAAQADVFCFQETHLLGDKAERERLWLDRKMAVHSNWSMARKQHSGEFEARHVGGTAIACRNSIAHSLQARPPELPDDKHVREHVASHGLDWAAATVRTTNLRFAVISVYLRPNLHQDHAITMQEIRRFTLYTTPRTS